MTFDQAVSAAREYMEKSNWLLKATAPYGCPFALVYFDGTDREGWLEDLITASVDEPAAYDGLRHISAALIMYEKPLPAALRVWAVDHLTGKVTRPARRGRNSYQNLFRDHMIAYSVKMLTDQGMTKTRNVEGAHVSACDAVAQAMNLSYEAVRSVLNK